MVDSTQNLHQELQEISKTGSKPPPVQSTYSSDNIHEKLEDLENRQILLVEFAYLLNAFLRDAYYWEGVKTGKKNFDDFISILKTIIYWFT